MLNHTEIEQLENITEKQRKMLLCIADYNEGWINESKLESNLSDILKND